MSDEQERPVGVLPEALWGAAVMPSPWIGFGRPVTDEERAAGIERSRLAQVEAWRLYDAARQALAAITDPLARAILDLHHADAVENPECEGCEFTGYEAEPPPWPCATVRLVAEQFEVALPDAAVHLWRRPA